MIGCVKYIIILIIILPLLVVCPSHGLVACSMFVCLFVFLNDAGPLSSGTTGGICGAFSGSSSSSSRGEVRIYHQIKKKLFVNR